MAFCAIIPAIKQKYPKADEERVNTIEEKISNRKK
jgi:hypothetical protein